VERKSIRKPGLLFFAPISAIPHIPTTNGTKGMDSQAKMLPIDPVAAGVSPRTMIVALSLFQFFRTLVDTTCSPLTAQRLISIILDVTNFVPSRLFSLKNNASFKTTSTLPAPS
jgi:hypothetical protein